MSDTHVTLCLSGIRPLQTKAAHSNQLNKKGHALSCPTGPHGRGAGLIEPQPEGCHQAAISFSFSLSPPSPCSIYFGCSPNFLLSRLVTSSHWAVRQTWPKLTPRLSSAQLSEPRGGRKGFTQLLYIKKKIPWWNCDQAGRDSVLIPRPISPQRNGDL